MILRIYNCTCDSMIEALWYCNLQLPPLLFMPIFLAKYTVQTNYNFWGQFIRLLLSLGSYLVLHSNQSLTKNTASNSKNASVNSNFFIFSPLWSQESLQVAFTISMQLVSEESLYVGNAVSIQLKAAHSTIIPTFPAVSKSSFTLCWD